MKKGKWIRTVISLFCVTVILITGFNFRADAGFTAFNQNDYDDIPYGKYGTLQSGGCGAVAFMNCIYYITGQKLDPTFVANYSVSVGARQYGSGTSVRILAASFVDDYGAKYKVSCPGTYGTLYDAKSYVGNGKACICAMLSGSTAGHYIVLAEYDRGSDCFYILDSNPRSVRNTWPDGVGWLSASRLSELCANKFTHLEYYGGPFSYDPTTTAKPTTTVPPTTTDEYYEELQAGNIIPEITVRDNTIIVRHTQRSVTFEEILEDETLKQLSKTYSASFLSEKSENLLPDDHVGTGYQIAFFGDAFSSYYTVVFMGDVDSDGRANSRDARMLLRYSAKMDDLSFYGLQAADATRDGSVNSADARKILRYSARLTLI